ncbi:amidohydrolase [Penaeicola halotolerans]|uniref:amidohydrolase n=1 Tax=Penaeicola halotolerans TaxID=2793196 RepID=UPI001CF8AF8A|nr:amidohydrolase [Penaeicola halotolerans]
MKNIVMLACLALLIVACQPSPQQPPVTILANAEIWQGADLAPQQLDIAIQSGKIIAIEKNLAETYPAATIIDHTGQAILPGFIDSHAHIHEFGQQALKANLVGAETVAEMVARMQAFFPNPTPGEWLIGQGWDEGKWAGKGYPDRQLLDEAFPDNPVRLQSLHGFAGFYNAKALEIAGINADTKDPEVGRIIRRADGSPTGVMETLAQQMVNQHIPVESLEQTKEAILAGLHKMKAAGVTMVHEAGMNPQVVQAYLELDEAGLLPIRVFGMLDGNNQTLMEEWFAKGPRVGSDRMFHVKGIKVFYDGSLGSRTALLFAPYSDNPRAAKMTERIAIADIQKLAVQAAEKGFQMAVHTIGDAGNDRILILYEQVLGEDAPNHRWRLEHAQIVRPDFYQKAAKGQYYVSMQSSHAVGDSPWAEDRLGAERIQHAYAWRNMLNANVPVILNSDLPGEPWTPIETLYFGVTRMRLDETPTGGWYPEQAFTLTEALEAMTTVPAKASFMEDQVGKIAVGYQADLVILDQAPWSLPAVELKNLQVKKVYLAGNPIVENH